MLARFQLCDIVWIWIPHLPHSSTCKAKRKARAWTHYRPWSLIIAQPVACFPQNFGSSIADDRYHLFVIVWVSFDTAIQVVVGIQIKERESQFTDLLKLTQVVLLWWTRSAGRRVLHNLINFVRRWPSHLLTHWDMFDGSFAVRYCSLKLPNSALRLHWRWMVLSMACCIDNWNMGWLSESMTIDHNWEHVSRSGISEITWRALKQWYMQSARKEV